MSLFFGIALGFIMGRLYKITRSDPDFIIGPPEAPYLLRWWVLPRNSLFNIYLHKILRDDDDRALHDHPWVNISVLLSTSGGLGEVLPNGKTRWFRRFIPIFRRPTALHRLVLSTKTAVATTLFITGPRVRVWGFQCPEDSPAGGWRPWQDFVADNTGEVGRGCGEMDGGTP